MKSKKDEKYIILYINWLQNRKLL